MLDPVLLPITTIAVHHGQNRLPDTNPVFGMGNQFQRGQLVVLEFIRAVAGQLTAAVADEMHGPLLINRTPENHPGEIAHQHLQHTLGINAIPGRFATATKNRKKAWLIGHGIVHNIAENSITARISKNLARQKPPLFFQFPAFPDEKSRFALHHAPMRCLPAPCCRAESWRHAAIIRPLHSTGTDQMEAEQLNSISNKLDDLAQRADELRRYL